VNFAKLERSGATGVLMVRIMRAANDLAIANAGYRRYDKPGPGLQEHVRPGARRYYVRLQCGHLNEALPLVQEAGKNSTVQVLIAACSSSAQTAFLHLTECVSGGIRHADFKKYVSSIRNRVAFHYDPGAIRAAIADLAGRPDAPVPKVTVGTNIDLWRFNVADDIEGSVVARQLWKIPRTADLTAEDDRISSFGSALCRDFIEFAGQLSEAFVKHHVQA
jgi:hypothetical protein